jgi:hypothetical protein
MVQQIIDPAAISGLLDPWIKQREQEAMGGAMGQAFSALQKEDYPGMARAMQTVAGIHPQLGIAMIGEMQRQQQQKKQQEQFAETIRQQEETRKQAEEHFRLTPRMIGGSFFGPGQYALPPAKPGDPWQTLAPGGGTAAPAPGPTPTPSVPGQTMQEPSIEDKERAVLSKYPPEAHQLIRDVEAYNINPNTVSRKNNAQAAVVAGASELAQALGHDPYNMTEFPARNIAYQKWMYGPQLAQLRSQSVAFEHIHTLEEIGKQMREALNLGDIPKVNQLKIMLGKALGKGEPVAYELGSNIVGSEVAKGIVAANPALADREEIRALQEGRASEAQKRWGYATLEELIGGQLMVSKHLYEATTRRKDFDRFIMPRARQMLAQLEQGHAATPTGPLGMQRVMPQQQPQQLPPGMTPEAAIAQAKAAIAGGKNVAAILSTLRGYGIELTEEQLRGRP